MDSYYGGSLGEPQYAHANHGSGQTNMMSLSGYGAMHGNGIISGDTLDDIVNQNRKEMERRRSIHQSQQQPPAPQPSPEAQQAQQAQQVQQAQQAQQVQQAQQAQQAQQTQQAPQGQLRQHQQPRHQHRPHPPHQPFATSIPPQSGDARRPSMMEFGTGPNGGLNGYQFDPSAVTDSGELGLNGRTTPIQVPGVNGLRRHSHEELALATQFGDVSPAFNTMQYSGPFHSPLTSVDPLNFDVTAAYSPAGVPANMSNPLAMDFSPTGMPHTSSGDATPRNHYASPILPQGLSETHFSPIDRNNFPPSLQEAEDSGGDDPGSSAVPPDNSHDQDLMDPVPSMQMSERAQTVQSNSTQPSISMANQMSPAAVRSGPSNVGAPLAQARALSKGANTKGDPGQLVTTEEGSQTTPFPHTQQDKRSVFSGVYSSSGFDMVKVLMRVATRPNPEINIGAVDMSCAFVVCDVTQHDLPIVYCSDVFERLTGYTKHEILGRNCRFLQSPDGKVQSGVQRKYVDDDVVLQLKNKVTSRREAQTSIINYRKGGQPFMNLLTLIPITWDPDDTDYKFYVGFQVDLVETPQSVTNKNPDGSYSINYQRGFLPRYVWQTPENNRNHADLGQTITRDDVSTVLTTIGSGESELSKRIWDKVLLENTDDVVHVLSLKGLFLYLSPSSRKVLEYDSGELVGTALSSVCHPSDIVPVTRELKDTSTGASVNVVFRIRRKHSGYTWFESHGSLHTEQGKGRKCIILVGRERPVYALARSDIVAAGGIGESELWTKMSTSGMFLYVSSNSKTLLDRQPEELIGSSIQALMRSESKLEFDRVLERARTGKGIHVKHEMQNKRGQVLQANTTIYPGDAVEGQKPTFFVAQTRFSKLARTVTTLNATKTSPVSPRTDLASVGSSATGTTASSNASPSQANRRASPPQSAASAAALHNIITEPGGRGLPIGTQDVALASAENVFDELKTTRSTSWQFELRQMEKRNRVLVEELQSLLSSKKKRKRRKGAGQLQKDCANCHTRVTPEWRRGPSGNRDLCNSCGLRWAKQNGRVSPRTGSQQSDKHSASPAHSSPPGPDGPVSSTGNNPASTSSMPPPPDRRPLSSVSTGGGGGPGMHNGKTSSSLSVDTGSRFDMSASQSGYAPVSRNGISKIDEE